MNELKERLYSLRTDNDLYQSDVAKDWEYHNSIIANMKKETENYL